MNESLIAQYLVGFLSDSMFLAGIPLIVATLIGLVISFFQAITQIQDQTLSQSLKIATLVIVFLSFGATLATPLIFRTEQLFTEFSNWY